MSRSSLLIEFEYWLLCVLNIQNLSELVYRGEEDLNNVLTEYGRHMYYTIPPRPVQHFAELLNAVRGVYPLLRGRLPLPWSLKADWQDIEPTESHLALPRIFILALVVAALLRGWPRPAGGTWLTSGSGLRPGELHSLLWRYISLPEDRLDFDSCAVFVTVKDSKGRWAGSKSQHARAEDPWLCRYISALRNYVQPERDDKFVGGGETWYRGKFRTLVTDTGARYGEDSRPKGVVEASLRASFASFLFEHSSDLAFVGWRMRIKNLDTLRHYVHELQSQQFIADQSAETRQRVYTLAAAAPRVIARSIEFLNGRVPPQLWPLLWRSGRF